MFFMGSLGSQNFEVTKPLKDLLKSEEMSTEVQRGLSLSLGFLTSTFAALVNSKLRQTGSGPLGTSHTKSAVPAETQDVVLESVQGVKKRQPGRSQAPGHCQ